MFIDPVFIILAILALIAIELFVSACKKQAHDLQLAIQVKHLLEENPQAKAAADLEWQRTSWWKKYM